MKSRADETALAKWRENAPSELAGAIDWVVANGGNDDETARVLAELSALNADLETQIAAILLPLANVEPSPAGDIEKRFGPRVATLVQGQLEAERVFVLHGLKAPQASAEGLRKLLLVLVRDLRVVLILLARYVVRLRLAVKHGNGKPIAALCGDLLAPLANRLGIWQIKWELEDLVFRALQPETYKRIADLLDERRGDRERYIELVKSELRSMLVRAGIECDVAGRPKHIFSIYKKMRRKDVEFAELYDVRAVRVLVHDVPACYAALGVVHSHFVPIPKEFDDYIAKPKGNDYRSLHTAVIGPEGKTFEVQIRTHEMHAHSELGVAAHWRYKEGGRSDTAMQDKILWMRQLLEGREESLDDGALLAGFSTELLEDHTYALTPKGNVIAIPKHGTVLDFAYTVHTEVGHRCRGAKVNGRIVPLTFSPKTGDTIEILTARDSAPRRDWLLPGLGFLSSSRARHKVRAWFNKLDREQNARDGKEIIERELKRLALGAQQIEALLPKFALASVDDLYIAVALGDISPSQIARVIHEMGAPALDDAQILAQRRLTETSIKRDKDAIVIGGVGNLMVSMAQCCSPVPGDEIVGFITRGKGVSVHRSDCKSLLHLVSRSPERRIDVEWGGRRDDVYSVRIRITAYNRTGLIRDVGAVLAADRINIGAMDSREDPEDGQSILSLTLRVSDFGQLANVLARIRALNNVIEAVRVRD